MGIFNRTRNSGWNNDTRPPSQTIESGLSNHEKSFRQNYFQSNSLYFKCILGSRLDSRSHLIESDIPILKEAYDKAHQKAQFEIDLHWRRTTHIWTLILALLVATGAILTQYFSTMPADRDFWAGVIFLFSIVCIVVTQTSLSMLKVSHMWCRNWELHVAMLEPFFSGFLYQTHLGIGEKRFSISKLNNVFIWIALACWTLVNELSIFTLSSSVCNFILFTLTIVSLISICGVIIGKAIQSPDRPNIKHEISHYDITPIPVKNNIEIFKDILKTIASQWAYGIIIFLLILTSAYIIVHFIEKIDLQMDMLNSFLNADLRKLLSFPGINKQS